MNTVRVTEFLRNVLILDAPMTEIRREALDLLLHIETSKDTVRVAIPGTSSTVELERSVYSRIVGFMKAGQKINAIKELREYGKTAGMSIGLREAKETVETMSLYL